MSLVSRFRGRISIVITLMLSLVFALASTSLAFAGENLIKISSDPFTNSTSQHRTEVEPDNYAFGNTIVATFQSGRFKNIGGSSGIGWATSHDGGAIWQHGALPDLTVYTGGPWDRASDPSVVYDAKHHTWMISSLVFNVTSPFLSGVVTSLSKDGGLTWSNPVTVVKSIPLGFDKNWITCDDSASSPFYGHCYTEWDTFVNNKQFNLINMSTSVDGGLTWQKPKTTADQANGIGGQPLVQPNGRVIVPIIGETATTADIASFISTDGGKSWSKLVEVASLNQYLEVAMIRNGGLPSAEIDGSGTVYVVWQDCRFEPKCSANDIVISTSSDGLNWSPVRRVPINPVGSGVDDFTPGIGVDRATAGKHAHLALTYYYFPDASCKTSACQLDVGFISSTNGGATWSTPEQLAGPMKLTWLAFTVGGYFPGDYISTTFISDGEAFPVFAVAFPPSNGLLNEAMYTTPEHSLPITGGTVSSNGDLVIASHPVQVSSHRLN